MNLLPKQRRAAVFLDRDDTLIANREVTAGARVPGDLTDPTLVKLLPGVAEGLGRLRACGFLLVVVSNQGCVARGTASMAEVDAVNARMRDLLRAAAARGTGADVDAIFVCPYHPGGVVAPWNVEHPNRKPAPGMVLEAARDLDIDLGRSWMIGDSERDVQAAVAAGIAPERCLLIGRGLRFADAAARVVESAR